MRGKALLPLREKQLSYGLIFEVFCPGFLAGEDRVCVDDEFAGAGDDGGGVVHAFCGQALVEGDQGLVPSLAGGLGCGEQGSPCPRPPASDVAFALEATGFPDEGRHAEQSSSLFARDRAEFGHAQDERERADLADSVDGANEIHAACQVRVLTHGFDEGLDPAAAQEAEAFDLLAEELADFRIARLFEAGLGPSGVFIELIAERQQFAKSGQPDVRGRLSLAVRGALSDDRRVDVVAFGAFLNGKSRRRWIRME